MVGELGRLRLGQSVQQELTELRNEGCPSPHTIGEQDHTLKYHPGPFSSLPLHPLAPFFSPTPHPTTDQPSPPPTLLRPLSPSLTWPESPTPGYILTPPRVRRSHAPKDRLEMLAKSLAKVDADVSLEEAAGFAATKHVQMLDDHRMGSWNAFLECSPLADTYFPPVPAWVGGGGAVRVAPKRVRSMPVGVGALAAARKRVEVAKEREARRERGGKGGLKVVTRQMQRGVARVVVDGLARRSPEPTVGIERFRPSLLPSGNWQVPEDAGNGEAGSSSSTSTPGSNLSGPNSATSDQHDGLLGSGKLPDLDESSAMDVDE